MTITLGISKEHQDTLRRMPPNTSSHKQVCTRYLSFYLLHSVLHHCEDKNTELSAQSHCRFPITLCPESQGKTLYMTQQVFPVRTVHRLEPSLTFPWTVDIRQCFRENKHQERSSHGNRNFQSHGSDRTLLSPLTSLSKIELLLTRPPQNLVFMLDHSGSEKHIIRK